MVFLKNVPYPASISLFLSFQYTVDSKQKFNINKFLPMTGFKPWTSGIESDRFTTAHRIFLFTKYFVLPLNEPSLLRTFVLVILLDVLIHFLEYFVTFYFIFLGMDEYKDSTKTQKDIFKTLWCLGGSPGLVVTGGDSWSKGCGFESQHRILDGQVFTFICSKIVMFLKRRK